MDSAPRFVAENCALKGVDALMKLAIAYIGINRLDGAAECLTCVARACAKPGNEGIERGLEVLGNEECLNALRDALKGPPVSSDAWDGQSSDDESTTSRTSSYYSGLPSPAGSQSSHYSTHSHSTLGSRPGSRQRRNRSRPGSALNTPRRPRSRPGSRAKKSRGTPSRPGTADSERPTTATSDDSEAERERQRLQAEAEAKAAQEEEEALAKQAMAEEKLRRERECQELLAASAGEIVAAIARRTNYDGLQTLKMMPEAVCASLRGLVETDDAEDGLGRVAAWAHGVLRCADALARGDFLALDLRNGKAPNFLRRLNPSLSALDRNGGDSYDCSQRVEHYCQVSDKPWKLLPKVDTIDPHDGYMVRAAPKYEVAKLILADLKRSKQPCSLTSWSGVGDDLLGRRTVVTRSFDETNRPPPEPLPEDETQKVFDEEMAKRVTAEGVAEVERERADTADRAAMHPRKFIPDDERGPPVRTDERLRRPVTGTRDYARRALPAPLVPSLKLRKRVFDRKITGRLGED
jgi:hypothetical protein